MGQSRQYRILRNGRLSRAYAELELEPLAREGKIRPLDLVCDAPSGVPIGLAREQPWFAKAFSLAARVEEPLELIPIAIEDPQERRPMPKSPFLDDRPSERRRLPARPLRQLIRTSIGVAGLLAVGGIWILLLLSYCNARRTDAGDPSAAQAGREAQESNDYERGVQSLHEIQDIMLRSRGLPLTERRRLVLEADRLLQELKSNPAYDRIAAIPGALQGGKSSALGEVSALVVLGKMATKDSGTSR